MSVFCSPAPGPLKDSPPARVAQVPKVVLGCGVAVLCLVMGPASPAAAGTPQAGRKHDTGVGAPTAASAPSAAGPAQGASPSAVPITRIAEIRTGHPSVMGRPVLLEAVVTYADPAWGLLFVQDREEGIFVEMRGQAFDAVRGDLVRVEGRSAPGDFAPIIEQARVTVLGRGALPEPDRPTFDELLSGDWDSQLVELSGVVRGIWPLTEERDHHLYLDVAVGTWRVLAQLPGAWTGPPPEHLVDAKVRIRGVAGTLFNKQRQRIGLQLFVPTLDDIATLDASRADPFSAPVNAIGSLNRWVSRHGVGRRVRIRGEVTWAHGRQVYVRDGSGSIAVTLWAPAALSPGQHVDAAGFVAAGTYSPTLEDAVVRVAGGAVEPAVALPVDVAGLFTGGHDAGLVTLEAEVVNQILAPDPVLVLKAGDQVFTAPGPPSGTLATYEPGTVVSVTGVCRVQVDALDSPRVPRGIQLLLRTPADVRLVKRAALSPRRTVQALALLFAMMMAGLAWIVGLRRRVAQQTQDLREQLDRERALEAQYRELVATANDLVVTCDADARVTSINEAGQRLTGQSAEAATGRQLRDLVAPADRARLDSELAGALASRTGLTLEVGIAPAGGAEATVELDVRPIYRRGRPAGLQAIGRDVTARKRGQEELAHARDAAEAASRAKSEFMANISHEVRTPLNGIIGMTELVLAGPLADQSRQYLKMVRSSADSLLLIINDILDFSRIEAGHLRFDHAAFDLPARLAATVEPLGVSARRKGLGFTIRQSADLPSVLVGDAGRLGQVLTNLVGNAIKFTDHGGITVETALAPASAGDTPRLARLRVTVSDTGIGIPADKHALIFDAFTQADGSTSRRFGGTGLGLSIVASIVKRMGGTLDVKSEPGTGSTFSVVMPFERGTAIDLPMLSSQGLTRLLGHPDQAPPAAGAQAAVPAQVLLVEDNPVNQRLAQEILRRRGHRVTVAENGREALRRLAEGAFDVVLMDVQMPEMNGLDATRAIRAGEAGTGRHIPIVAMTAHAMAGDRERCLESGMDDYMTKPVRADELAGTVERYAMTNSRPLDAAPAPAVPPAEPPAALPAELPAAPPAASPAVGPHRADVSFNLAEALQRVDGDMELLAEIAGIFLADAPGMLAEVAAAVAGRDGAELARTAHRLKGSILTFSAPAAAAAALALETAGRTGELAGAEAELGRLTSAMTSLQAELGRIVATPERKTA